MTFVPFNALLVIYEAPFLGCGTTIAALQLLQDGIVFGDVPKISEPQWPPFVFLRSRAVSAGFLGVHSRFFFLQKQRRIHTITLIFTIHYVNSQANGSLITLITFTCSL